jgi:hypothetical protein
MTWSSYPQHQLVIEGFRDFFKKKNKSSATYPASELTTIVNLISNLAKKFDIETDTRAIIDEFEAMLKSQNIDLQEQDDRLMIGADLKLNLERAPKLKQFILTLKQKEPKALQPLVKALKRGAFDVGMIDSSPADNQSSDKTASAKPRVTTPATPEKEPDNSDSKKLINLITEEIIKVINEQSTTQKTNQASRKRVYPRSSYRRGSSYRGRRPSNCIRHVSATNCREQTKEKKR